MATYTSGQLRGSGSLNEEIPAAGVTFNFDNPSMCSYFTFELLRDADGFYPSSSPNFSGVRFNNVVSQSHLISSDYMISMVVPEGTSAFSILPKVGGAIISSSWGHFRGTGEFELTTTPP